MRERAIAEYHERLARDVDLTPEFFAGLKAKMHARGLAYGERAIGVALRPHMLDAAQYEKLARASQLLAGAFETLTGAAIADPSLLEQFGLTDRERTMALVEPGFRSVGVTTRLDAFIHGDELKFVEYNAENPSSLPDQDGLNQILFDVQAMQSFAGRYRLRPLDTMRALLDALLSTYREWSGRSGDVPHVAIVDWDDLPTATEFVLIRDYFALRGVPTIICAPDELEYSGGHLLCGDFPVDLVYKRVIIHELLTRYDETHPLCRAYAERAVCLVNPFRCKLMHKKAAFELLTAKAHAHLFTAPEHACIRACVPWTRRVSERRTDYRGEPCDLLELIRRRRARFVLKPNDDYGGLGISLGHLATAGEWDDALKAALAADYVVQERVELHREEFPVFDQDGWSLQAMYVDTNPFLFNGKAEGALVRLSGSPIVNVTSGGGETGFVVLDGATK
ncbi:MAG TPA: hypothetical protein VF656_17895 [Pyrinomonadaceae bacterium]|jgi:hypothetical protein